MAFDYNLAASKYFIDRTADHHVVSVGNVKTNESGAISVSVAFNVDAEGKITYSEPQIYHKYAGDDAAKKDNLYKTFACLDADLVGTWANPTVGAKQTIDGKECEVIEILDPSANYEKFTLNNFGKFVLCKGVAGGMDTDAVAIDNASDEKDDDKVMTARAIEKSLAWENVNGKTGSIVSYIKNGETGAPDQPTVTGEYSLAFGHDEASDAASSADGDKAIALNSAAIGEKAVAFNGIARGKQAIAINGKAETEDNDAVDYAIAIGGEVVYDPGTPYEYKVPTVAANEGSIAIGAGASAYGQGKDDDGYNIAIGSESIVEGANSVAIGSGARAVSFGSIAIGGSATGGTDDTGEYTKGAIAIAGSAKTENAEIFSIDESGEFIEVPVGAIAIGIDARATAGIAIGDDTQTLLGGIAIGLSNFAGTRSAELGYNLKNDWRDQFIIGCGNATTCAGINDDTEWLDANDRGLFIVGNGNKVWMHEENPGTTFDCPRPADQDEDKSNAFMVMANGDIYAVGIGGYNGSNNNARNVIKDAEDNPVIDPLTGKMTKLVKPVQDVIFEMQKKIEYLEGVIEHITEVINN